MVADALTERTKPSALCKMMNVDLIEMIPAKAEEWCNHKSTWVECIWKQFALSSCNPMSVAQATCFRMKREKVVALHAIDWQSFSYSKHKEHTNSSTHNLQAPRFTFSILIQKSGLPKKVVGSKIFIVWWGSILWHQLGQSLEVFVSWFHRGAFGNTLVV